MATAAIVTPKAVKSAPKFGRKKKHVTAQSVATSPIPTVLASADIQCVCVNICVCLCMYVCMLRTLTHRDNTILTLHPTLYLTLVLTLFLTLRRDK